MHIYGHISELILTFIHDQLNENIATVNKTNITVLIFIVCEILINNFGYTLQNLNSISEQ
jgi:hypothetical protein